MINISDFDAFLFDMDGTLLDSMGYWRGENRKFMARHNLPIPKDIENILDIMSGHALARRIAKDYQGEYTFEAIVDEYGREMPKYYQTVIQPKQGAKRFLEALKKQGKKLAVVTATHTETARMALKRHDMLDYFELVTDETDTPFHKSDPKMYIAVAEKLGVKPERCVMFEDALYAMKGAKAAGLTVFAIFEKIYTELPEQTRDIPTVSSMYVDTFDSALKNLGLAD